MLFAVKSSCLPRVLHIVMVKSISIQYRLTINIVISNVFVVFIYFRFEYYVENTKLSRKQVTK